MWSDEARQAAAEARSKGGPRTDHNGRDRRQTGAYQGVAAHGAGVNSVGQTPLTFGSGPGQLNPFLQSKSPAIEAARRAHWAQHWKNNPHAAALYDED